MRDNEGVTSSSTPRRRRVPRRVVRPVGEPGAAVPSAVADLPAGADTAADAVAARARATRSRPSADPLVPRRAADDTAVGWHEADDSNDERLRRDVPPHWG